MSADEAMADRLSWRRAITLSRSRSWVFHLSISCLWDEDSGFDAGSSEELRKKFREKTESARESADFTHPVSVVGECVTVASAVL
jgi:hypothetical protein